MKDIYNVVIWKQESENRENSREKSFMGVMKWLGFQRKSQKRCFVKQKLLCS